MSLLAPLSSIGLAALLGACSSCPPFQATWYMVIDDKGAMAPQVAMMNSGDHDADVRLLYVNSVGGGEFLKINRRPLRPGEILIFPSPLEPCVVPFRLRVACNGEAQPRRQVEVTGSLSNYLLHQWCPVAERPTPPAPPTQ